MKIIFYGFITTLSIIAAIGVQSSFVIKQGLKKQHVFLVCTLCGFFDFIFMNLGIFGVGSFLVKNKILLISIASFGILFLLYYSFMNFKAAFSPLEVNLEEDKSLSLKATLIQITVVTLLNPHLYLDSFIIIASISSSLSQADKIYFAIGAVSSSFFYFYSIGYGARLFLPIFKNPLSWKILDFIIACIMLTIAILMMKFIAGQI